MNKVSTVFVQKTDVFNLFQRVNGVADGTGGRGLHQVGLRQIEEQGVS